LSFTIRDARDDDAGVLIELIGSCFAEYPGCVLDVDAEAPELRAIATYYRDLGGRFWVAERDGSVVGCIGVVPSRDPGGVELQRLYVGAASRRRGLATRLCDLVFTEARERDASFVDLWSDTRFGDAHRLYDRLGFVRGPDTRELHDRSRSVEYYYRMTLAPAVPIWRRWNLRALVVYQIAAFALIGSWIFAPTRVVWDALDEAFFGVFNASLRRGPEWWRMFWAIGNHKFFDGLPALLTVIWFFKFAVDDGRRHLVRRFAAGAMIVLFTVAVHETTKIEALRTYRASPTLEREEAVRLNEEITWIEFKIASPLSFPGDHDIFLFMLAIFFWYYGGRRYGLPYAVGTIIFTLPRMVVGAHWLTDNLVGAGFIALGSMSLLLATPLASILLAILEPPTRLILGRFQK
jgi:putative acetyltransferase